MANNYEDLFNSDVVDVNGDKIGAVGQVYLDDHTGQPSWVTVKTGWFGLKETFVPLEQAVLTNGIITVPYLAEKVKDAPRVDPDKHLDADEEAQLYSYYGIATVLASEQAAADAGSQESADPQEVVEQPEAVAEPTDEASPVPAEEQSPEEVADEEAADEPLLVLAEGQSPEEAAAPPIDDAIDPQVAPADDGADDGVDAEGSAVEDQASEESPRPRPSAADLYNDVQDPDPQR